MLKILMFSSNTYLAGQTWRRIRPDRAQCRTQVRLWCSQGHRCYECLPPNSSCDIPASAGQRSAPPWRNKLKWSPIGTRATRGDSSEYRSNFRLADYVNHNMIWKHCASVYVRNRKATRMVRPCYEEGTHGRVLGAEVPGEAMLRGGNTRTSAGCGSTRRKSSISSDRLTSLAVTTLCGRTASSLLPTREYQACSTPSRPRPSGNKYTHIKEELT